MAAVTTTWVLKDLKIAPYNIIAGTYGADVDLNFQQTVRLDPQHDTDILKAGGVIKRSLSILTHFDGTLSMGELNWEAMQTMTGSAMVFSDSGGPAETITQTQSATGDNLPYFGVLGKMPTDNSGDILMGLYVCQLQKIPVISVSDQNKFVMFEVPIRVFGRESDGKLYKPQRRANGATALPTVSAFLT